MQLYFTFELEHHDIFLTLFNLYLCFIYLFVPFTQFQTEPMGTTGVPQTL